MKSTAIVLLTFCLCAPGCGGAKTEPLAKQIAVGADTDQIQGAWIGVGGSDNGTAFTTEIARLSKVVVSGAELAMYEDATTPPRKMSFHLDPTKTPKEIDFTMQGKQVLGLYELNGDRLKLIMMMPGKPRPADFNAADDALVLELKRGERPAAAAPAATDKPVIDKSANDKSAVDKSANLSSK